MKKLLFLLLLPMFVIGQIPTPKPNTYVNDLAGLLTETQINELNLNIRQIEVDYSIQIAIVLVKTTGEIPIDDYARQIGRSWHVGNAKNGLVYVAALDDHKQRLEVAQNLEGTITDIRAHELTDIIKGFFHHQQYYAGLNSFLQSLTVMLKPVQAEQKGLGNTELEKKNNVGDAIFYGCLFIVFCLAFGFYIETRLRKLAAKKAKLLAEEERKERIWEAINVKINTFENQANARPIRTYNVTPDRIPEHKRDDIASGFAAGYMASSSNSSSDSSSSNSSSASPSYGDWGSDSSNSSSSSDSGFSGGGSSNDL